MSVCTEALRVSTTTYLKTIDQCYKVIASCSFGLLYLPLFIASTGAAAGTVSGDVSMDSLDHPGTHIDNTVTVGPSIANIALKTTASGVPGASEVIDHVEGQISLDYDEIAAPGVASDVTAGFTSAANSSSFRTDTGFNATVSLNINVDAGIFGSIDFSTDLISLGPHFTGAQFYTPTFGPSQAVALNQNENFVGIGGSFDLTVPVAGSIEVGATADITLIRRDTLTHQQFYATLTATHRETGTSLSNTAELTPSGIDAAFIFNENGWWDIEVSELTLQSAVVTQVWQGVSGSIDYYFDDISINSPPIGSPAIQYPVSLDYEETAVNIPGFSILVEPLTLSYPPRIYLQDQQPVHVEPTVSGLAGTPVYTLTSGTLPAGTSLDSTTGLISGVAVEEGDFLVEVTATGDNTSVSASIQLLTLKAIPTLPSAILLILLSMVGYIGGAHLQRSRDRQP